MVQEAYRFTSSQELVCVSNSGHIRYNIRKLNMLPYLHSKLSLDLSIELTVRNILFDYNFMHTKFLTTDIGTIIQQLSFILGDILLKKPNTIKIAKEMNILIITMFQSISILKNYPNNLALQFTARLLQFYKQNDTFHRFINDSDSLSYHVCALLAPYQYMHSIDSGHFLTQDYDPYTPIEFTLVDAQYLITCSSWLNVFDLGKLSFTRKISQNLCQNTRHN